MSDQRLSIQMKNRRKIAAKRVFVVFGNNDAQTGFQGFCISACGSECRGFESHRAPSRDIAERQCLFCPTKETSLLRCLFLFCRFQIPTYRPAKFFTWSQSGICALVLYFYIGLSLVYIYLYLSLARCRLFRSQIGKTFSKH